MLGDQISVRGNVSDEGQWLGSLGYSLPIGTSGLRGNVGYAHTRYELAKQFARLDAKLKRATRSVVLRPMPSMTLGT